MFDKLLSIYGVKHVMGLTYHPQSNEPVEISNKEIKHILEKIVNTRSKEWLVKLDNALGAYRTTYKSPIGMSPYMIVFGNPYHLPLELEYKAMWAIKKLNCYFQTAKEKRLLQMNKLEELGNEAYDNARICKYKTKKLHDQRIMRREFKVGELILLYNSRLKLFPRKLKLRWSGPYTIVVVTPFGAVTLKTNSGNEFNVNGQRLKHYLGGSPNEAFSQIRRN